MNSLTFITIIFPERVIKKNQGLFYQVGSGIPGSCPFFTGKVDEGELKIKIDFKK